MLNKIVNFYLLLLFIGFHFFANATESNPSSTAFELVVLGDSGGAIDGNLSAFLLRSTSHKKYIALDAGTLLNGIDKAVQNNAFDDLVTLPASEQTLTPSMTILHDHVAAYMISHAHLDHIAGLVSASPDDNAKPIYALPSVNQAISHSYFNWQAWPNFSDRGKQPRLKKYKLIDLPQSKTINVPDTGLKVTAFSLSHPVESTAFVIENNTDIVVYFGDTGPDEIEKQNKLDTIWKYVALQLKHKKLRGLIIEASFPDEHSDQHLYGHLTPKWLTQELTNFSLLLDSPSVLQEAKIIVSHVKSSPLKGVNASDLIHHQLEQRNVLGLHFIMAKQGHKVML